MRRFQLIPLLLSCSVLAACGGDSGPAAAVPDAVERQPSTVQSSGNGAKDLRSACDVFSADEIRAFFGIPADLALDVSEAGSTFPDCSYQWGKDLVVRTISAGGQNIEVRDPAKVVLVIARNVSAGNFDTSTSVYKDAEDVPGIGDMARWGASMSQLSVLADGNLYHVHVKASSSPEENRRLAEDLAGQMLQRMR